MKYLTGLVFTLAWLTGIYIAKGFWMTLLAIFPPFGVYLFVVEIIEKYSLL